MAGLSCVDGRGMALRRSRGDEGFDEAHESIVYGNGYGLVKPHKSGDQGNHYGKMLAVVLVLGYVVRQCQLVVVHAEIYCSRSLEP